MKSTLALSAIAALAGTALAGDAAYWRSQSIYQIMTDRFARTDNSTTAACDTSANSYCGGTWKGIQNQLDYIQGMGFTAIWISPINTQIQGNTTEGQAYHGYWPQDLYGLNSQFGTLDDLKNLVTALHNRKMAFMLDVTPNSMAWAGAASTVDYSKLNPFNQQSYYHSFCDLNSLIGSASASNATQILETCWLGDSVVELADLKTEDSTVASMLGNWIKSTVSNYSVDGLRIDAAKHIAPQFFPSWLQAAGGIFGMGEVLDGDAGGACAWQKDSIGSVLNYPIFFPIRRFFGSNNDTVSDITSNLAAVNSACSDPTVLGSFSESHDLDRFPTLTSDVTLAENLFTYSFLSDGIPIIYQGQEQHQSGYSADNSNRQALWLAGYKTTAPLYKHLATLNMARTAAIKTSYNWTTSLASVAYEDSHVLGLAKGPSTARTMIVVNNNGAAGTTYTVSMQLNSTTGFAAGTNLTDIVACNTATVGSNGILNVPITQGKPIVYLPTTMVKGSGLCGTTATTTSSGSAASASSSKKSNAVSVRIGKVGAVLVAVAVGFVVLL